MNTLKNIKDESLVRDKQQSFILFACEIIFSLLCLAFFSVSRSIFPSYFFNDNVTIRNYMQDTFLNQDKSFINTAKFFLTMGFSYDTPYFSEAFLSWIVFISLFFLLVVKYKIDFSKIGNLVLLLMFTVFYGAYVTQLSKELVIFILLTICLAIAPQNRISWFLSAFIFLYGVYFRTYWLLIFVLSIVLFQIFRVKRLSIFSKISLYFATILVMEISYNFLTQNYLSNARYSVNLYRMMDIYSNTIINNPLLNTSLWTDMINFLYGLINIFIPINGINSANEIMYYVWIWSIVIVLLKNIQIQNDRRGYLLAFIVAMLSIQAFFEPDIGSMLRHQIVLIPIILLSVNREGKTIELEK